MTDGGAAAPGVRGNRRGVTVNGWRIAACLGIYVLASVVMGREVLAHLSESIANDAGDPLLTTAILHWVATHVPYTDAWYQLPIFHPSRDTLTDRNVRGSRG